MENGKSNFGVKTGDRQGWLILAGFRFENCLIYLDDVTVHGRTFVEEPIRYEEVIERIKSAPYRTWAIMCPRVALRLTP